MDFLYTLEALRTPFWNAVLSAVTNLGDEILFMAVAITVFWCISKRWGYYLLTVGFFSTLVNQFAKIVCRVPRPWVRDSDFTIVESARAGATGYSFPSGHTANVTATLGCCARFSRSRLLRAALIAVIALVAFSRLYLGVHAPADVLFSLGASTALVFAFYPVFAGEGEKSATVRRLVAVLTGLSLCFALWLEFRSWPAAVDPDNLASATKNGWLLTGGGAGMLLGLYIDQKYIRFDVRAPWWAQILKVALGLAFLLGIKVGLKAALTAVFGPAIFPNALRYFAMVVFASCVWPLTFRWFAAGCPLKRKK